MHEIFLISTYNLHTTIFWSVSPLETQNIIWYFQKNDVNAHAYAWITPDINIHNIFTTIYWSVSPLGIQNTMWCTIHIQKSDINAHAHAYFEQNAK